MSNRFLRGQSTALLALLSSFACACSSDKTTPSTGGGNPDGGGADAASACPSKVAADTKLSERNACTFEAGSKAVDSLGITEAARKKIPLEHIIVVMKENRSFDHLFGDIKSVQPDAEGIPDGFSNKDKTGAEVKPFHLDTTCVVDDPGHQWKEMHAMVNGGKMDGFVTSAVDSLAANPQPTVTDGHFVMGYYEESDLPFYYFLAKTYALADHHFPSTRSGTWADRDFLYAGTSDGVKDTAGSNDPTAKSGIPGPDVTLIFDEMKSASVSWAAYTDSAPLSFALLWGGSHEGVKTMANLFDDLSSGNLPAVSFIDGKVNTEDDHPSADVQKGEAWLKKIYDATIASPVWDKTAIIYTYDEGGGFFDHVPPPEKSCVARPDKPQDQEFVELGVRVPLVAISPWARRHYVSHVQHQHTSITRLIELVFDLPALTKRDANSDALLDMFDFECPNSEKIPEAPAAGTGGCANPP